MIKEGTSGVSIYSNDQNKVPVKLSDFCIKKVIGRGSFGKVFLVQKISDGKVFAMKALNKDIILKH